MTVVTLQWIVLGLCIVGAAVRVPAARRGAGRVIFSALVLLSVCVGLSIAPIYGAVDGLLGGINLSFWPMGPLARRTGVIYIRRSFAGDPVYKLCVRGYFRHLVDQRAERE